MSVNTAPIKWAQRSDSVYITIALADVKEETINLTDKSLVFKGKSEKKDYEVNIDFFEEVDAEGSTYNVLPRSVQMHVMKKDKDNEEFWPRLLKDKLLAKNQIKVDWDRYVDEDEEEEAGGFDMSQMQGGMGMGGQGGMPGMGGGMPGMGGGMPPGMGGMPPGMGGGMPGMDGSGMAGMDMEALMKQMGGMGDLGAKMKEMEATGELDDLEDDDDDDDDLEDLPELEDN